MPWIRLDVEKDDIVCHYLSDDDLEDDTDNKSFDFDNFS
jgi:hypothetical protein